MAQDADVELAESLAEMARTLLDESAVDATLDRICEFAVKTIDACQAAGISMVERGRVTSRSTTDEVPRAVDRIQSETQEGPCVDAIKEHEVFITGSLSQEQRWPDFAQRAHQETGVESILSLRLFAGEETMGALNLYSREGDAFDDHDIAVGSVFAAHAAIAWSSSEREAQLEARADSRNVIGMAKGIIIAQQKVSDDEAFRILRRASQRMNIKLRELAERIVDRRPTEEPPSTEGAPNSG